MQVNLVDRYLMDRRLGLAKAMKQLFSAVLRRWRQGRALDQRADFRKAPVRMPMRDRCGGVRVAVIVRLSGSMTMAVRVLEVVFVVNVPVGIMTVFLYDELRGGHARTQHTRCGHARTVDGQGAERKSKLVERQTGIEQRAQDHVAGCAVETVEIENTGHERYSLPASRKLK